MPNSTNPFSDDPPPINPYAAPDPVARTSSIAEVRDRLRVPAIFLIVLSALSLLFYLDSSTFHVMEGMNGKGEASLVLARGTGVLLLCNLATLIGSVEMLRMRSYRKAVIGASIACVPVCTTCILLGVPFGIWALVILRQSETIAAFQALASTKRK
jgi:hypothetical protein